MESAFPMWKVKYKKRDTYQERRHPHSLPPPALWHSIFLWVSCRFQVDLSCFSWSDWQFSTVFEARHRVINTAVKSLLITGQKWACPVRQDVDRSLADWCLPLLTVHIHLFFLFWGFSMSHEGCEFTTRWKHPHPVKRTFGSSYSYRRIGSHWSWVVNRS